MPKLKIRLENIKKSFEENVVLNGVNLSIGKGEIVAIAGENGAGKSTLMKILSGALFPNGGTIYIDDKPVTFHRPQDAMALRIRMIYQELNLIRDLSVAENLFLVDESRQFGRFLANKEKMYAEARRYLQTMGLSLDPRLPVARLNVAQQQLVEILKSLVKDVELLIMDEPTAALSKEETDSLFMQIRKLKQRGISVIYISHRLEEIFEIADRVIILRDGQVVLAEDIQKVNQAQMVTAMVGKQVDNFYPKEHNVKPGAVQMQVSGLTKGPYYREVSFNVYQGEVLGIGGLMGSGKSEILRCLFGDMHPSQGEISIIGARVHIRNPKEAIKKKISFLTADRKQEGLITDMSIYHNLSLPSLKQFLQFGGYVNIKKERKLAQDFIKQVNVKARSPFSAVRYLSGGNQQKVVFGKWMMTSPRIFMMEEPTRGVDVGAKSEIYRLINNLTREGISVLLVSSDIPELVAMSDRVIILREGKVVAELQGKSITQHNVLHYAMRGGTH